MNHARNVINNTFRGYVNMGNDKRFLKREKLFDMSIGELRNYHERLLNKYRKASPKMKNNYKKQANIVKEIIDIKTGAKPIQSKKKSWLNNKGCAIPFFIFLISVIVIIFVSIISGNGKNQNSSYETSIEDDETSAPEENTSEMVDYIASEAKKSANQSVTEEKRNEAIEYIYSHYPDYFSDNETMESTMYYGYYLEYAYAKNGENNLYANLGMDAYQAVKYVYRNTEEKDSEHVKENIKQIADSLYELGYEIK